MARRLFFSLLLVFGLGFSVSSCAPGVYAGATVGTPAPYYGPHYGYRPGYYARPVIVTPRPVIVRPAPIYRGGFRSDAGYHGGRGHYGGGGFRRGR